MATTRRHGTSEPANTNDLRTRAGAVLVLVAPLVLLGAIAFHPFIEQMSSAEAVGQALHADTDRWGVSHYLIAVGGALLLLAILAVRAYLRDAGEDTWSARAVPPLVLGSALFMMLPAMELGILGGAQAGADAAQVQHAADTWFVPTLLAHALMVLVGSIFLARGVTRSGVLGKGTGRFVAVALVGAAVARFIPLGVALYAVGVLTLLAFWPLGVSMWRHDDDVRAEREWNLAAG